MASSHSILQIHDDLLLLPDAGPHVIHAYVVVVVGSVYLHLALETKLWIAKFASFLAKR